MATKEQLRALRKKHHLGEYRNNHTRKSQGGLKMAKRTRARRSSKRSGLMGNNNIMQTGLGVGAYILFETMVEPKILAMANIQNPLIINAAELLLGAYMAKKPGIMGSVGKAAVVINLYQILQPYLSGSKTTTGFF